MQQVNILWAAATDLPAGWPLLRHAHSFYHLFFIRSGWAVFLLDGNPFRVCAGDCVIAGPEVFHEIPEESHSLLDVFEVKFSLQDPHLAVVLKQAGPVLSGNSSYLKQALPYILCNWARSDPAGQATANTFLLSILLSVQTRQPLEDYQVSTYIDSSGYSELIRKVIGCIEKNHTESFSLDQLAAELGYNKRYLCAAFKNATGVTIWEYLNHIRIRHATLCFCYNDVAVAIVAQHIGFVTPVHFTRVFRKLVGVSPSQFRKIYRLGGADRQGHASRTPPFHTVYEELLGVKMLPLEDSIRALRELGRRATVQD